MQLPEWQGALRINFMQARYNRNTAAHAKSRPALGEPLSSSGGKNVNISVIIGVTGPSKDVSRCFSDHAEASCANALSLVETVTVRLS